jgi:hypothetical protein
MAQGGRVRRGVGGLDASVITDPGGPNPGIRLKDTSVFGIRSVAKF